MRINDILTSILRLLGFSRQPQNSVHPPAGGNHWLVKILHMVNQTDEVELTCDEVLEFIDRYSELAVSRELAELLYPKVRQHLDCCKDCREEYEALVRILKSSANWNYARTS